MSTNNFLKFMTEEFVKYLNQSKEEKKERKEASDVSQSVFLNRWLGVLPFSLKVLIKGK